MEYEHTAEDLTASKGWLKGMHPGMSLASKGMILSVVVFTIYNVDFSNALFTAMKDFIISTLNWFYISIVTIVLGFVVWMMFSKYGKIRLGKDTERPEFSNFAWFSMLFSAGLGLSILYWGVAEPILHLQGNPFLDINGIEPMTQEAAVVAMRITVFHGGVHGWGLFVLVGMTLAYLSYRRGLPLAFRSVLYPLIGNRMYGGYGHAFDLIAVFGTVFGLATSLGLGVSSINAGFDTLFGIGFNTTNQMILIVAISVLGSVSAATGVGKGVKILSEVNIWLSAVFLAVILAGGATSYILTMWISGIGDYIANVIPLGLWLDSNPESDWQSWWTIFYWGWWIAWSPFVGLFIARISRGRTIREFVIGVLLAPTMLLMFWFFVLGGQAVYAELYGAGGLVEVVNQDYSLGLFKAIESLDWQWAVFPMCVLTTFLLISWFVTSSDSGTLVVCTILSMGDNHPPKFFRIFWGIGIGVVAAVLMLAGGLDALQTAVIAAGLPVSFILIIMMIGLVKALNEETADTTEPTVDQLRSAK